jgi:beta-glucosidase
VSNLILGSKTFKNKRLFSVTITNSGKTAGKEISELYLSAPEKSIDKPKRVKGFWKETNLLQPGESQTITLEINAKDPSFICSGKTWIAGAGGISGNWIFTLN